MSLMEKMNDQNNAVNTKEGKLIPLTLGKLYSIFLIINLFGK